MSSKRKIFVLSNTHWDREWYMPLEKYRVRLVRMMDRLVQIMEADPNYVFITDGQYMMVQDYLDVRPEMKPRIQKLAREGRLKIGPWYAQPLETLISGEAMCRNLLYGLKKSQELGGAMYFSYMVDEFGHAAQTPMVLREFGVQDALAWRGMEPGSPAAFEWKSPSGQSVIMHYSYHGYGEATSLPLQWEDYTETVDGQSFSRKGLKNRIEDIRALKEHNAPVPVHFWLNGIDHSWAQPDIGAVLEQLREAYPQWEIKQSSPEEYAAAFQEECRAEGKTLRVYEGELMNPYEDVLQSTHSCRADHKLTHYRAERLAEKWAEPFHSAAVRLGMESRKWAVEKSWELILENHAHDTLGCCSVDEVFEQAMARYGSSISLSQQVTEDSFRYLMSCMEDSGPFATVFYAAAAKPGCAEFSLDIPDALEMPQFSLRLPDGGPAPCALLKKEKILDTRYNPERGHPSRYAGARYHLLAELPGSKGLGVQRIDLIREPQQPQAAVPSLPDGVLENEFLKIQIQPNGALSVFDKETQTQYDGLLRLEESGDCGNFYLRREPVQNTVVSNPGSAAVTRIFHNFLGAEYQVEYAVPVPCGLTPDLNGRTAETTPLRVSYTVRLLKGWRRADIRFTMDCRADDHQVRLLFPTGFRGVSVSQSGQPYCVQSHSLGLPKGHQGEVTPDLFCHPMQDFCSVSENGRGLMIAAKGVYEYEAVDSPECALALTLVRNAACIDRYPWDVNPDFDTRQAKLRKPITWELSILPHGGSVLETWTELQAFLEPPKVSFRKSPDEAFLRDYRKPDLCLGNSAELVAVSGQNVVLSAVKLTEERDTLLVRLLNLGGKEESASLSVSGLFAGLREYRAVNMQEKPLEDSKPLPENRVLSCTVPAYAAVSIEFLE